MNKPTSVKFVQAIIILKLFLILFMSLLIVVALNSHGEIAHGIRDGLHISNMDTYHISEYATQFIVIPMILIILSLVFLIKRKYVALLVIFIIQLISSMPSIFASILIILQLSIIIFNSNAKKYLQRK